MAFDRFVKYIARNYDFLNNFIFNAKTEIPTTPHDKNIANIGYVKKYGVVGIDGNDFPTIENELSQYQNLGHSIFIKSLGINVKWNGTNWIYDSGEYKLETKNSFFDIPNFLKFPNIKVNISTVVDPQDEYGYIVLPSLGLSEPLLKSTEFGTNYIPNRYYQIAGSIYFALTKHQLIELSKNSQYIDHYVIVKGDNLIEHELNSSYVLAYIRIKLSDGEYLITNVKCTSVSNTEINIKSSYKSSLIVSLFLKTI